MMPESKPDPYCASNDVAPGGSRGATRQ